MTTDSGSQHEGSRRRQERLGFVADCQVSVQSPAYAMVPKPIPGQTSNVTMNGLKVLLPGFPAKTAATWRKAVDAYERIKVQIDFPYKSGRLSLPGNVVWFQADEGSEDGRVQAAAGILFSVLRESELRALKELVAALETNYE